VPAINRRIRRDYETFMSPAGAFLCRLRLSPNLVSVLALLLAGISCVAFALEKLGIGLGFVMASVFVDMLDGSVARASGRTSAFGTVVDHTTDRYAEFLYILGLCYGGYAPWWLGFLCYFSMLMPSYIRAKVESSGSAPSVQGVGIAERKEKLGILILSTALAFAFRSAIIYGFIAITVISQVSAFQRLYHASRTGRRDEPREFD
jgi:phosphatidylglycerophosphate synthase